METKINIRALPLKADGGLIRTNAGELSLSDSVLSKGYPEIKLSSSITSHELLPNTSYIWEGTVERLVISFGNQSSGFTNEYSFQFTCPPESSTVLSLPSNIKWVDGNFPNIEPGYTYLFSIVNNLGVYIKFI